MQRTDITQSRLQRLAGIHVDDARVLSVYVDLDPGRFGTSVARTSAIRSVLDEASRAVRATEGLEHDELAGLRTDLERLESYLTDDFSADGVAGLAIFACGAADLFEVVRLPRPPATRVAIADAPFVEPLVRAGAGTRYAVLLVSRADGRLFRGTANGLTEVETLDEDVHGQHSAGGLSQARYQRSVDVDAVRHVERVIGALRRSDAREPFELLLIAVPDELGHVVEEHLEDALRTRLAGRFRCDVSNASAEDVLEAARPAMLEAEARRERDLLDRLSDSLGMGQKASSGLGPVLDGLVQRRVATLFVDEGFSTAGVQCPTCGWLGAGGDTCPVDGSELTRHEDIVELAVAAAEQQSADVVFVRWSPDLDGAGVASLDRF